MILAIDPGKDKCGLAVLNPDGQVLQREIVARELIIKAIPNYLAKYRLSALIVGRGHFGKELAKDLYKLDLCANIIFVSEKFSSREARQRYWQDHRPKGLWRFVPTSLRLPPVPVDDYAAVILGERYLKG